MTMHIFELLRRSLVIPFALASALAVDASAQQSSSKRNRIDENQAIRLAVAHNPLLKQSMLEVRSAGEAVRFQDGRYPYTLQLDAGLTRSATPLLSGDEVATTKNDTIDLGAQIGRTFPTGTTASLRVEGSRQVGRAPVESGPGYGGLARASISQPLMRGAGSEVGEADLRAARLSRTVAELSRDRVASEMARDVLLAYWDLWYAERALEIEKEARELAKQQRDEAAQRAKDGALAPVEVLPFETRVATLEESVVLAASTRRTQAIALAQQVGEGQGFSVDYFASTAQKPLPGPPALRATTIERAQSVSPLVREMEAKLRLANERLRSAGDNYRPRLDLEGYVQVAGLGNGRVPPAFEQMGKLSATSAHIGLVYELPLDDSRKTSERAQQMYAVKIAQEQLRAAHQAVQAKVETLLAQERAARQRYQLAEHTAKIAKKQYEAEKERYDVGVSISVQVREAEDEVRQAKLRVEQARVDIVRAQISRDHLIGALLPRLSLAKITTAQR